LSRIIKAHEIGALPLKAWQPTSASQPFPGNGRFAASEAGPHSQGGFNSGLHRLSEGEEEKLKSQARQQGLEEARALAQQELQKKLKELEQQGEEMEAERRLFFDKVEPELARLAVGIAEKVIAKELETSPEIVIGLVRNAMKRMRERETLRVRLNPEDLPLVKAAREDLMAEVNGVNKLDLQEDRRVGPGGCMVESSNGVLDATIKTQLEKLEQVIIEASDAGDRKDA
jgi:flagellar assembly protein FliH